jgi:hypothetical protein
LQIFAAEINCPGRMLAPPRGSGIAVPWREKRKRKK